MSKNEIRYLSENICVEVSIECSKCKKQSGAQFIDEDDFAEDLFSEGWRSPRGVVYCPACAKKHLKSIKKKK